MLSPYDKLQCERYKHPCQCKLTITYLQTTKEEDHEFNNQKAKWDKSNVSK